MDRTSLLAPSNQPAAHPRPAARWGAIAVAMVGAGCAILLAALPTPGWGLLAVRAEPPAVAAKLPEPSVSFDTPGFAPGRADFTGEAELEDFLASLRRRTGRLEVKTIGDSQQGLPIRMLAFGAKSVDRPTVLLVAMQRGDAPAAGEAALVVAQHLAGGPWVELLDAMNVLVVPRANPDGALLRTRGTASGIDLDADHLLLRTPEARALADVMARHRPDVVIELGEFDPGGDWIGRYGGWIRADASLQPATPGNPSEPLDRMASQMLLMARRALDREGLATQALQASLRADTLRNVGALRAGVALQVESRGVGLERGHFLRRVHTHATAVEAALRFVATHGEALRRVTEEERRAISASACVGELVIRAVPAPERRRLSLLDPQTGAERSIETAGHAADPPRPVQQRPRPCGYLVPGADRRVAEQLKALGASVRRVESPAEVPVDRYVASADGIALQPGRATAQPGDFFVSMSQPLANLIAAALEPDAPASLAASGLPQAGPGTTVMRVTEPVTLKAADW